MTVFEVLLYDVLLLGRVLILENVVKALYIAFTHWFFLLYYFSPTY